MLSPKPFTSTALLHVGTTPPAHGQRLNEEIAWKKITTAKNNQMDILQQLYDQRHAILTMIHTNTSRIQEAGKGKEEALAQQDYSGLDQQEKQLDHWKSDILQGTQSLQQVTLRIQREWSSLVQLMRNESSSATKVAQAYQTILHDREAQFQKYQQDTRLHFQRLQDDIQKQREALAADKSELAFDQDFMKQSSIELEEKMADAVHQEKEQKEILIEKMVDIDTEIQALMQRVAELKDQRQDLQQQVDRIDQHMERALTSFLPDQQQHQTERQETDRRKQRLERQERNLDQKEAMLHQARQREQEKQNKEQTSLDALQATLDQASQQATTSYSDDLHQVLTDCLLDRDKKLLEALAEQQRLGRQVEQQRQQIHQVRKDWWAMQDQLEDGNTTLASLEMKQTRCDRQMKRALQQDLYDVASHCQMELQRLEQEISSTRNKNQTYQDRSSQQQGQLDTLQESLARLKQSYDQQWQASSMSHFPTSLFLIHPWSPKKRVQSP
ncbi:hypothetical protein DM01DRAFT_1029681 [Hesseltinella vesiculosa]|uniref:Uncharacterized protein n=1 Tax=Hesseltinella vesiculosa TaxID=101127 RepID=A0A1X2GJ95_9FUNG|nr:hypothetical protein DM01DRAFT_1029681 [Hesseltinella vesiculosa]